MADYATVADLRAHWAGLPADREVEAQQKLHEASIEVRSNYPDIDTRLTSGALDPEVAELVVCRMVKRAMDVPDSDTPTGGMESIQFGAGPFQVGGKVHNPDGNVYLSKSERRMLDPAIRGSSGGAFSIFT